ncbi:MAG: tRNA (N6-threonylcarbamoyladenosine(37)-N6)-methyltransferase TrmO [Mycobacteriales bacterium]
MHQDAGVSEPAREFSLRELGRVASDLIDRGAAPKQGDEGAPDAWIEFADDVRPALTELTAGDEVVVLTWLDQADRDVLRVRPRDDPNNPETGVFSTRSADRPNPIGLHRVTVLQTEPGRLRVGPLEAVHGTPVIDVKPVLGPLDERSSAGAAE